VSWRPRSFDLVTWLQLAGLAILIAYWVMTPVVGRDADNFWNVDLADPYREPWGGTLAYVYSPAFAQLISPLTLLPYELFYKVWQGISMVSLAWLLTPVGAALALALPFVRTDIDGGQIHLWLAVMCVVGMTQPGAWAFGFLTKVTPGIGVIWFAARREWRATALALAVTAAVVAVSAFVSPRAWADWVELLIASATLNMLGLPLSDSPVIVVRGPVAAGLLVIAAWRGRPAAIPLIVCFALPTIWPGSLALLAAIPRISRWRPASAPRAERAAVPQAATPR
jgi:hypothetical protein